MNRRTKKATKSISVNQLLELGAVCLYKVEDKPSAGRYSGFFLCGDSAYETSIKRVLAMGLVWESRNAYESDESLVCFNAPILLGREPETTDAPSGKKYRSAIGPAGLHAHYTH